MDGPRRIRKTRVARAAINMVMLRSDTRFAAHGRNGIANEQRKKFVARTSAPDASLMHENNLIDQ
jgi:hypothetical protein